MTIFSHNSHKLGRIYLLFLGNKLPPNLAASTAIYLAQKSVNWQTGPDSMGWFCGPESALSHLSGTCWPVLSQLLVWPGSGESTPHSLICHEVSHLPADLTVMFLWWPILWLRVEVGQHQTQFAQCGFCYILLAEANHKASVPGQAYGPSFVSICSRSCEDLWPFTKLSESRQWKVWGILVGNQDKVPTWQNPCLFPTALRVTGLRKMSCCPALACVCFVRGAR